MNLLGVANCIRSFVPRMIAQGIGGHIVNTASMATFLSTARHGAYCATKHAVLGLSDALRIELAPFGIGVSVLCPGNVTTNIAATLARPSVRDDPAAVAADLEAFLADFGDPVAMMIEPDRLAALALWGVSQDEPYIVAAPGQKSRVSERFDMILGAHDRADRYDPALP